MSKFNPFARLASYGRMRYQDRRRDSKFAIADTDDGGTSTAVVEGSRLGEDIGPLALSDPGSLLLSMSEYDKNSNFGVYDYNAATRSQPGQDYRAFATHQQTYAPSYVGNPSQVPSGLPQSPATFTQATPTQHYGTHDPSYYAPQNVQYTTYVEAAAAAPRPLPEIISYSPASGPVGTKVTVQLRSLHDFDLPPVTPVIMFGGKRCPSVFTRATSQPSSVYQYSVSADAPPLTPTSTPSPQVPISLTFEDSDVDWHATLVEFGRFTYVDSANVYPANPNLQGGSMKKRKLDPEASPRRSPTKKPSIHGLSAAASPTPTMPATMPTSPQRRPGVTTNFSYPRRFSGSQFHQSPAPNLRSTKSQYFPPTQASSLQTPQTPAWTPLMGAQQLSRYSSTPSLAGASKSSLLRSPASNPALVRTSTIHQSPSTPSTVIPPPPQFNPYSMYPAKAILKIEGDLNTMTQKWTPEEWEAGRRLVQFRRSQQGSVINATFEAVTPEDRVPNSICVSCIWWAEREECYVTSVDTISLLESLVAVRFTVEEKNRIRRNLEGFRPLTVSKTKQDSDDFFKLIMGFPNPKPRNIEKDVKVFPWRILNTALKKIIGKYSASYSSTAGVLHAGGAGAGIAGPSYAVSRAPDYSFEQHARQGASPLSTASSAASYGHVHPPSMVGAAYAVNATVSTGLGIATGLTQSAAPDLRLTTHQAPSWHHPSAQSYSTDMPARTPWDLSSAFLNPSPGIGLPNSAPPLPQTRAPLPFSHHHQQQLQQQQQASLSHSALPVNTRFVPLDNYGGPSQQTSNA